VQDLLIRFLVPALVGAALLGALTGWLSSLQARPFRWLAEHPLRTFWIVYGLLGLVALVAERFRPGSLSFFASAWPVLAVPAIQGLRVSYLRRWWKALLILFPVPFFSAMVDTPGLPPLAAAVSVIASWATAAMIAHQIGQRVPGGAVILKRPSTLRHLVARLRAWPYKPNGEAAP
jgi:hypothetical protein